jgi:hypothetical protein
VKAWLNLRYTVPERRAAFVSGLQRLGYEVAEGLTNAPGDLDILVTWNRINVGHYAAIAFEQAGRPVIVAENAAWSNDFLGGQWYSLAQNRHNTAGMFPVGGPERWDDLGVELLPFRSEGETVILPQRGIGAAPTAMPRAWPQDALRRHGGRVRYHPGTKPCRPLECDLAACGRVVTWGSGAAIKALMLGIPVTPEMPGWIGACENTELDRLAMLRRLAWAQWRLSEIESGEAFAWLLQSPA